MYKENRDVKGTDPRLYPQLVSIDKVRNSALEGDIHYSKRPKKGRFLFIKNKKEGKMAIKIRIPKPLQRLTNNQEEVNLEIKEAIKVVDLILKLDENYRGVKERLINQEGKIGRFVLIFINDEDMRFLNYEETLVKDGDEVSIVPAIAGG